MKKSKVAVVACPDYEPAHVKESLQKGLEAIGGLESLIGKEENILLKPNLVRSACICSCFVLPSFLIIVQRIIKLCLI